MAYSRLEKISRVCKALSDITRLRIFLLLTERTLCVNAIVNFLGISQPAVSQHLKILREAGLVKSERKGYWMHYSADLKKIKEIADILLKILKDKKSVFVKVGNKTN